MELVQFERLKHELAIAVDIDEVKEVRDKAEALRLYAKQTDETGEMQNQFAEIKIRAERRAGELIPDQVEHGGDRKSESRLDKLTLKELGISKFQSSCWQKVAEMPEEVFEEHIKGIKEQKKELTSSGIQKAADKTKKEKKKDEEKERLIQLSESFNESDIQIFNTDFQEFEIENNSIDLILTDPPYPGEYLYLWQSLFDFASQKLKPSSFLVVYTGQMYLDKILKMENDLIYYWLMNVEFTKKPLIHGRNVINEWKPIFVFQKPPFKKPDVFSDKIHLEYSKSREMHDKNWGQTVGPFEFLLERFSNVNDLVFEPFAGTGTTLRACKNKKRKCIGTEIEEKYIDLIRGRLVDG